MGFNTDLLGFDYSLRQNNQDIDGHAFAIIGAGGSAQSVGAVLAEGQAQSVSIYNRSADKAHALKQTIEAVNADVAVSVFGLEQLTDDSVYDCVINTTTVGMSPNGVDSPVPDGFFNENTLAFDLVYNPKQTQFLAAAEKAGCQTANGMQMLVAQAVYSVEIWMGGNIVAHVDMNALVRDLEKLIK